jgi:hypothetical protein
MYGDYKKRIKEKGNKNESHVDDDASVLDEIHSQILLYRISFSCLNECEEHFSVGRKETKRFQHFEGEDQYRTSISTTESSTTY